MHSITSRITGLMFLSILSTVVLLVYLANYQMDLHFGEYLAAQRAGMGMMSMMGSAEQTFLDNIHRSLYWVGGAILLVGLFASYTLARSITVPIRKLGEALSALEMGQYGETVDVDTRSEIGKLAGGFNRMSKSLAEQVALRRRLLADVAHELRTPLTVIQGNLEGMLEGVVERSDETLNSLREETEYLSRMIKDLRDLSLAEAGQLSLEKVAMDVNLIIHRVVNMLEPLAYERNVSILEALAPSPPLLLDERRINQVLYNLLTNAIRYTPENGEVCVNTQPVSLDNKNWLQISVIDNGCGIPPEDLPFIFEHFYRADQARDKKSGGSGIGLAIVKQLVELHGGFVEVHSKVGEGSQFEVFLPIRS
jgi:two-component system sensor histidine kinase BaeS